MLTSHTQDCIVKAMVFPIVMYGCESWTIKKAERWRIDAFKLWCWKRLLRASWTARQSNQSILKEINLNIHWKDWCWSSNTLATWCEELTLWKDPEAGNNWRQEEKGATEDEMVGWHHRLTEHEFEQTPGYSEGQGSLACCSSLGCKESDTTEQLNSNDKVCTSLTTELEGLQVSMHWIINPIRMYWTAAGAKHS